MLTPENVINDLISIEKLELFSLIDDPSKEAQATELINRIFYKGHEKGYEYCMDETKALWRNYVGHLQHRT